MRSEANPVFKASGSIQPRKAWVKVEMGRISKAIDQTSAYSAEGTARSLSRCYKRMQSMGQTVMARKVVLYSRGTRCRVQDYILILHRFFGPRVPYSQLSDEAFQLEFMYWMKTLETRACIVNTSFQEICI